MHNPLSPRLIIPVDDTLFQALHAAAAEKGVPVVRLVNEILRRELATGGKQIDEWEKRKPQK